MVSAGAPSAARSGQGAPQIADAQSTFGQPSQVDSTNEPSQATDELDALLGSLESDAAPAQSSDDQPDDLDNLLASLDSEDASKSADQTASDFDADLAAMLADL